MTYFLGLLGVLQMLLAPGLILYRLCNQVKTENFWLNLPLITALSLIFNYFMVFSLTGIHYYTPHVLRSIFVVEVFFLFYCYPRFLALPMITATTPWQLFNQKNTLDKKYTQAYFWTFLLVFLVWIALWSNYLGQVFGMRDPSVSYNMWAIAWAQNQFPTLTWHYPQLLSSNWSIPYVMMGTLPDHVVLEMFPASFNLLVPIFFMIIFLDLFRQKHDRAYLLAGLITSGFMASAWAYIHTGYMDWVCAYLNLLSLKLIYQMSQQAQPKLHWRWYLQILLVLAASALSKPAGITTAVLVPLLMVSLVRFQNIKRPEFLLFATYILLFALIAPWYFYAETHEILPSHGSDLLFLIWEIFRFNTWLFYFNEVLSFGWVAMALLLATFFFSKSLTRFWRFVFYFYSPYFFIWALFYSYDERNLDLLLPILAISVSLIISHHRMDISIMAYLKKQLPKFNKLWLLLAALIITASIAFVTNNWHRGHLIKHEIAMKNQIEDFRPGFIDFKNYVSCPGLQGKILSPMLLFATIPMLTPYMIQLPLSYFGPSMLPEVFNNLTNLQKILATYPDIRYFLFDMRFKMLVTTPESRKLFDSWLKSGKIKVVFNNNNLVLYEIMVPPNQLNFTLPSTKP
jgi:hypothetical protein